MYHLWINAAIQMTWKTGVGTMLAHIVHADEGGLKVRRTFLSAHIDGLLSIKGHKKRLPCHHLTITPPMRGSRT